MFSDRTMNEYYAGTKRIRKYEMKEVLNLLDDAYFAMETDEKTLKDAERPLINDLKKAQELIFEAMEKLIGLTDAGFTDIDHMIWDLKEATRDIKTMKIEVDVRPEKGY